MIGRPKLVLASGSPRRLGLLNQAGIEPDSLKPTEVDEIPKSGELPRALATRLARAKADSALEAVRLDEELRGAFVVKIVGSYTNVVGLPLYETLALLSGEGYPVQFGWLNAPV